jgi:hypothetical protein
VKVQDKLGTFARLADQFSITDLDGNPVNVIEFGKTVVHAPFRLVTKAQIAIVFGVVTPSMMNAANKASRRW